MIYFMKNDELIEKYQVNFDKEIIEKLKNEIIYNCSFVKHAEYESDYFPSFTDEIIRNFTYTPTGKKKEYFEETRDIYLYSYDEYNPPYLVELINQLLNEDSKAIDKILNYEIPAQLTIDDRINYANQEFDRIAPEDITKKKEKIKELEDLLKAKELNKEQQSIDLYYDQLIGLIKFDLIDSLSISELDKVESFLGVKVSSRVEISESKKKTFVKLPKK